MHGEHQHPAAFLDDVVVTFLADGRLVRLARDLRFRDRRGAIWRVPEGYVFDGASIPRVFWRVIGGPLDGPYRDASVVHDYLCDHPQVPWRVAHLIFWEAMRARGVRPLKAWLMWAAVRLFGPGGLLAPWRK